MSMNNAELLAAFSTTNKNLFLTPLMSEEDFNTFGVEYGDDDLDKLESWVEDASGSQNKLIFTGHRGCGKSTLLSTLCRQLADRYFTVFFSIADMIERIGDKLRLHSSFQAHFSLRLKEEIFSASLLFRKRSHNQFDLRFTQTFDNP